MHRLTLLLLVAAAFLAVGCSLMPASYRVAFSPNANQRAALLRFFPEKLVDSMSERMYLIPEAEMRSRTGGTPAGFYSMEEACIYLSGDAVETVVLVHEMTHAWQFQVLGRPHPGRAVENGDYVVQLADLRAGRILGIEQEASVVSMEYVASTVQGYHYPSYFLDGTQRVDVKQHEAEIRAYLRTFMGINLD
jgi:hypothetical protein